MLAVMLFLGHYMESPTAAQPVLSSLATVGVYSLALLAAGLLVNRVALSATAKRRYASDRRRSAATAELILRVLLTAAFILALTESALPWSLAAALGWKLSGESFAFQLVGLGLYVLLFFCAWFPMYRLHREVSFGKWTRTSFLVHKARYNLYMILAWLPFALLADWLSGFVVALPLLFLFAAWTFPYLLGRVWGCKPLTDPGIIETVKKLEEKAGAKFSRVYLWEPGGGVQNAAAVGIFRPFRYLFLTPALVANMNQDELEGVILHELGHVRKKHLLFYLFTSLAGVNLAILVGAIAPLSGSAERFAVTAALVLGYFRFVFGWLSRNMERQADLFALEKSDSSRGLINALEKLGLAAGNIRLAASWHHLGIAERVHFLRHSDRNRRLLHRHNAGVARIMIAGYLLSFLAIASMAAVIMGEYNRERSAVRSIAAGRPTDAAHWRRVMMIMPGSPVPPLELAYRLAGQPNHRDEAAALAQKAMRLSCGGEEKAAAAKLIAALGGKVEESQNAGDCDTDR